MPRSALGPPQSTATSSEAPSFASSWAPGPDPARPDAAVTIDREDVAFHRTPSRRRSRGRQSRPRGVARAGAGAAAPHTPSATISGRTRKQQRRRERRRMALTKLRPTEQIRRPAAHCQARAGARRHERRPEARIRVRERERGWQRRPERGRGRASPAERPAARARRLGGLGASAPSRGIGPFGPGAPGPQRGACEPNAERKPAAAARAVRALGVCGRPA